MPLKPSLRSATLKAGWGGEHLGMLTNEIAKFLANKVDTVELKQTSETGAPGYVVKTKGPALKWPGDRTHADRPMLIGDCAYNARAALDHIAFQLVRLNGIDVPGRHTEFPIFRDEEFYCHPNGARKTLEQIKNKAHRDAVLSCQPFVRAKAAGIDVIHEPLWALYELRNTDTHRELHTVKMELKVAEDARHGVEANFPARVIFDEPSCPSLHQKEVVPTLQAVNTAVHDVIKIFRPFFGE
jgi:hypothetical protein